MPNLPKIHQIIFNDLHHFQENFFFILYSILYQNYKGREKQQCCTQTACFTEVGTHRWF